ncbi:MAG: L-threonylcarbamoyladenylate synthase [Planctomycetota bacterium]|nr:L-threonylcarbamoyladenylate synthase [Planctomycetota bacterium]
MNPAIRRDTVTLRAEVASDVAEAGRLLRAGRLVAVPTETVYGLAADATNPNAVADIFAAKGRPRTHPLIVHIGDPEQLADWAAEVPGFVGDLARAFWPGPLTLLLDRHPRVHDVVTGGLPTIGLRMPDHPALLQVLRDQGLAVAAPSANRYQKLSPTTAAQVLAGLEGRIDAVLDGGPCAVGTESTILRVTAEAAEILRAGPIGARELQQHLGVPVRTPTSHAVAVPGNQSVHYQPSAPIFLMSKEDLGARLPAAEPDVGCLVHSPDLLGVGASVGICLPADHAGYRRELYAALHRLDGANVRCIWVERPPQDDPWLDIQDRLGRAASRENPNQP